MKRYLVLLLTVGVLLLAFAAPVAAHNMEVDSNGQAETKQLWVGGFTLPEPAWSAPPVFGPFHLPPSHATGLPHACNATNDNPSAVTFIAPGPPGVPDSDPCQHGPQP